MDNPTLKTRKLNHILFSEELQKRLLSRNISKNSLTEGAIGQIDLVGSTAFTVSKTSIKNKLEKEVEIFEAHLAGNRLDFEDEILLTRNDLIKRDLIYNVKSIAYNGKIIGRLARVADWLGLEVLCTEGDKIIVAGKNISDVICFCLSAAEIFKLKSKFGHEGFGFRCGISAITPENSLYLYKNEFGTLITAEGKAVSSVEKLEATAEDKSFFIDELIAKEIEGILPIDHAGIGIYKLKGKIPVESGYFAKIQKIASDFAISEENAANNPDVNYSVTKKKPIAFISLEIKANALEEIQNFIEAITENNILVLRLGIVKNNRVNLICQANLSRNPVTDMLVGFKKVFARGFRVKVGMTYDYLWTGNISLDTGEKSRYDVMGQSINKAARMAIYSIKQDSNPKLMASEDFITAIREEGHHIETDQMEFMLFPAKGFEGDVKAFFVHDAQFEEAKITLILNSQRNFSEKVLEVSRYISELIFLKTKNHHLAINAPNFLIAKILTFTGLNSDEKDPRVRAIQEEDFYTLVKVITSNITYGNSFFGTFESIISKIPNLEYPRLMIEFLEAEAIADLTNLALITFGRVYDFRLATLKFALGFSEEKIAFYQKRGLIIIDEKRGFAHLLPPLAYLLDIRATQEERLELHTKITMYLWKGFKKYKEDSSDWYEKGRVLILHSRYSSTHLLPDGLKEDLVKIFEFAMEKREYLDLLFFDKDIFDGIAILKKQELIYKLALIHIYFDDLFQSSNLLSGLIDEREKLSLSFYQKVEMLYTLCHLNLNRIDGPERSETIMNIESLTYNLEWINNEEANIVKDFLMQFGLLKAEVPLFS